MVGDLYEGGRLARGDTDDLLACKQLLKRLQHSLAAIFQGKRQLTVLGAGLLPRLFGNVLLTKLHLPSRPESQCALMVALLRLKTALGVRLRLLRRGRAGIDRATLVLQVAPVIRRLRPL